MKLPLLAFFSLAAPWLLSAAGLLVVIGLIASCCERGLLRRELGWFGRLSRVRRMVLVGVVGLATMFAGTKEDGGRFGGPSNSPRMMLRPGLPTPAVAEDEVPVTELFPAWTNAATNLCITGVRHARTNDYLRVHWPLPLPDDVAGFEVYARPRLETNDWEVIGEAELPLGTNSTVVAVPHALLPEGYERSMFYLFGFGLDSDGDGLSDLFEELILKTDPHFADADGDGIPDGDEVELGTNPLDVDSDQDGLTDSAEIGMIELMPQESVRWRTFYNAHNIWPASTIADVGFATITLPCPYTVNGITFRKARVILDGVIDLLDPSHEEYGVVPSFLSPPDLAEFAMSQFHVAIAAFCDNLRFDGVHHGSCAWYGTIELPSGPASIIEFDDCYFADGQNLDDFDAISFQVILPSNEPNVVYLTYSPMYPCADFASRNVTIGVQCPILMLDPVHEGEEYYNLTWKPTAEFFGGWRTLKVTIGRGTDPASSDTDGDGFADDLEISLGSDPTTADGDTDSDGLPDAVELLIGTDPANADTDYDGLEDFEEYTLGTDPLQPDTDGDGLDDGWEMRYDGEIVVSPRPAGLLMMAEPGTVVPFDPTVNNDEDVDPNNDSDEDPDDDGLTNSEECAAGTNPCVQDTDGDGVDDQDEVGQGSDPTDPSDEGDSSSREAVSFYFGDHSDSHSEKYRLEVTPLQGVGARPQTFSKVNEKYGQCETRTVYFKPGWSYEVRLFHSGTKPGESVDYDYTLQLLGDLPANVFVVDEDTLFGRHDTDATGRPYAGDGKVAHLYVLKVDVAGIKFNHTSDVCTNDAVNLRRSASVPIVVSDGEWTQGGATNEPACYPGGIVPTVKVKFRTEPASFVTRARIRAESVSGPLGGLEGRNVMFAGGESDWVEFRLSVAIPRKLDRFAQTWRWKAAQVNGGASAEFNADTTGPHTIYTTVADPKLPWTPNGTGTNEVWTSALDFVYDNIPGARVLVDVPERTRDVIASITSHLFSNMGFRYDKDGKPKYGGYYDEYTHQSVPYNLTGFLCASSRYVNCSDMALGVATLGGLAGAKVSVFRTYPFGYVNTVNLIGVGVCNNPMYESDADIPYWVNVTNELTGAVERIEHQGTALPLAVCPSDETRRGYFASHLYVVDAGGNVHDACVGPELGTRGITPYLRSVIDYSTPNEADRGNYHTDPARAGTTENMNKNFLLK